MHGSYGTLTKYDQLKSYWFNPDKTTVVMKIRDTRDYGDPNNRQDYYLKLEAAQKYVAGER